MTTTENPYPTASGSSEMISNVDGTTTTTYTGGPVPSPLPNNYPIGNTLDPDTYPYSPAGALGLDPAIYDAFLNSRAVTTVPNPITGLVVMDANFPTGGGGAYSGDGILILHNPRYDPRYFDPSDPLYSSATSPIPGQTAAQYRADPANAPRYFNYNASNTFKGIVIADCIGEIGPGITGNAAILGGIISLDRVNGSIGAGNSTISYSSAAIEAAKDAMTYARRPGTYRQLLTQ
jgi:hypothetical protein